MLTIIKKLFDKHRVEPTRVEIIINYIFSDKNILKTALTHPSSKSKFVNDYQRLEFFGDAVLNYIVSDYLFQKFTFENEGFLSVKKSTLVSSESLGYEARKLNLIQHAIVGASIDLNNDRVVNKISADLYESMIGAITVDSSIDKAKRFVESTLLKSDYLLSIDNNYKGKLIEYCHKHKNDIPNFNMITSSGPAHDKIYNIELIIDGKCYIAEGKSIKDVQQKASKKALSKLI